MQTLIGHTSPETAYVVDDYPYGWNLRCKIRYWLEFKPKHGFRICSQTTNPKRGDMWNKPKAGVYHTLAALVLNDDGHVEIACVSHYDGEEKLDAFLAVHGSAVVDHEPLVRFMRAACRASKRVTVTIHKPEDGPAQTLDEQRQIMRDGIRQELVAMRAPREPM